MKKYIFTNQISRKFGSVKRLPIWLKDLPKFRVQIKLLRETLGMTQTQLGKRTNRSLRSIQQIESGDAMPRLKTLESIANSMNAELKIFLIPKLELEEYLKKRANTIAQQILGPIETSAGLEIQLPSKIEKEYQTNKLVTELLEKHRNRLWE